MTVTLRGTDHLYAIADSCTGSIKVGRSGDPEARLAQLQIGCPSELSIWWTVKNGGFIEPLFHALLGEERVRGEWYPSDGIAEAVILEWRTPPLYNAALWLEEFARALHVVGIRRGLIMDAWEAEGAVWSNSSSGSIQQYHDAAKADRDEHQRRMDTLEATHLRLFGSALVPAPLPQLVAGAAVGEVLVNG